MSQNRVNVSNKNEEKLKAYLKLQAEKKKEEKKHDTKSNIKKA